MQQFLEELFFASLLLALVVNAWYLLFRFIVYIFKIYSSAETEIHGKIGNYIQDWLKQAGNSVRAATWVIAVIAVAIVWLSSKDGVMGELRTEITGIAITVILIDELVIYRNRLERKQELIEQLYSSVRDIAVEALRLVRQENGWFEKINKSSFIGVQWSGASLNFANLVGAEFFNANLEGADLIYTNLARADLSSVNLAEADLIQANLVEAWLVNANLTRACLSEANLEGAILADANLAGADFEGANLAGAKYNRGTTWPKGFNFEDAGAIYAEWDSESRKWLPVEHG